MCRPKGYLRRAANLAIVLARHGPVTGSLCRSRKCRTAMREVAPGARLARLRTLWAEPSSEQKSAIAPGPYGAWLKSVERENARRGRRIRRLVEFSVVFAAIALVIPSVHDTSHGYAIDWVLLDWAIGLGVTGGVVLLYDATNYKAPKTSYMNDWRREAVYEPLQRIESDLGPLIMFNQRRIDQYHELTLSQAQLPSAIASSLWPLGSWLSSVASSVRSWERPTPPHGS